MGFTIPFIVVLLMMNVMILVYQVQRKNAFASAFFGLVCGWLCGTLMHFVIT